MSNISNTSILIEKKEVGINFKSGDIAFELLASTLLWILVPGCGFFYSGMTRSKSSLTVLLISFWSTAIVCIQWYLFGYSLAFSPTSSPFIGDFQHAFLIGVFHDPYGEVVAGEVPELIFCLYQGITAMLGPALILGVIAERGRMIPAICFIFLWTTLAYDPMAYWSLNYKGWSARLGGIKWFICNAKCINFKRYSVD